jgi:hypothetical protein
MKRLLAFAPKQQQHQGKSDARKTLQFALNSLRHPCQGQASLVRRNGGSEALQKPFRAYHQPMII